ncbi:universal stress protein [Cupriavidus taiwanensis]|uniref:universal stress protein n=1 Tax=Cupriavidus taiwanensis TaxID=164546 RepID=UPI0015734974|nr:universal stress protein [Cupriavidus taiwanensis]NSX14270.1 universal stress protein [Cupriavidus taiwanensis]
MNKILLATDGSPYSDAAARYLARSPLLSRDFVVHVVHCEPDVPGDIKTFIDRATLDDWHREQNDKAMGSVASILDEAGIAFERHGFTGFAPARIVEYANQIGAGLIVMGSHGRGGFLDAIVGSVARRVLAHAQCPVLLVRK